MGKVEIGQYNVLLYGNSKIVCLVKTKTVIINSSALIWLWKWCRYWCMRMEMLIWVNFQRKIDICFVLNRDIISGYKNNGKKIMGKMMKERITNEPG